MSNIDHYTKAEELIERYYQDHPLSRNVNYLIEAQVHATLATAQQGRLEYVIDIDDLKKEASKI